MKLTRRATLLGLTTTATLGRVRLALAAAPTDRRFVVVLLRGALDGMAAVAPYGDPAFAALRGKLAPPGPGAENGLLDLGGFYGLHPSLAGLHAMYQAGELLPFQAVAGPYRTRSHFEGQDCMESGADHRLTSGWLNRAVQALPAAPTPSAAGNALAVGVSVPLLLRGPAVVGNWAPKAAGGPDADLYARLAELHHNDPITGPAIAEGLRERGFTDGALAGVTPGQPGAAFAELATAAGRFMRAPDGPRVAALELGGWDTHVDQANRLRGPLKQLDGGLMALKAALGDVWSRSAVLVITEFGRTARPNGTAGTDHGTGTVAFVLGGAVQGGTVRGTWPGLADAKLLDGRDLQPTTDVRAIAKGLLAHHLGLPQAGLAQVFPSSEGAAAAGGLIRA